jgi:hypothetical protein
MLYESGEHQQLVDLDWSQGAYDGSMRARDAYLATELLSKAKFLKLDVDPELAAWEGFLETENQCRITNRRFSNLAADPLFKGPAVELLNTVRRKVSMLLGELPETSDNFVSSFCPKEWIESCGWGPGTTARIAGNATNTANKFQRDVGMTKDCYALVSPLFSAAYPLWGAHIRELYPSWGSNRLDLWLESGCIDLLNGNRHGYFDPGNIVLAVPKKAKIHRIISKEPGVNCFFQLGIGKMLRRRLLRYGGFDLKEQGRNQLLAFYASLSGKDATIDHKDASGLIATNVVREVFPSRWFSVMDSLRSKSGVYRPSRGGENTHIYYEKFSSMGNGFTFPLQSILFAAMALAATEYVGESTDHIGVYGDDVILPVAAVDTYFLLCEFMGLKVNQKKSFSSGSFRESCGSHYWEGADLKPFYLKERLRGLSSVYRAANGIKRMAHRNFNYGCDVRLLPAWRYLYDRVPEELRFSIPEGYGDGGFVVDFDEATPASCRRWQQFDEKGKYQGIEGFRGFSLKEVPVRYRTREYGLLLARLSDLGLHEDEDLDENEVRFLTGSRNMVGLRRTTRTYISISSYHEWSNLGPWDSLKGSLFLRACSAWRGVDVTLCKE